MAPQKATARVDSAIRASHLLACGIAAAPLFLVVVLVQAITREGFDLTRHPISLLSLGDLGWIQIANFVVTGCLYIACAVGMRRVLHPGPGSRWGPLLIGIHGLGMAAAGVFLVDAGAGYPPGAPSGAPEQLTWHGLLHELGFVTAFLAWIAACLVFARRLATLGRRGWPRASLAVVVAVVVITAWPDLDSLSVRLVISTALSSGLVAAIAHVIRRDVTRARRDGQSRPSSATPAPAVSRDRR